MKKTNETSETRSKAIKWWDSINGTFKQRDLGLKYFPNRSGLTGREIEEIWRKENKIDADLEIWYNAHKPNQKQFKAFNPELFQSYISKFSGEDKFQAFSILAKQFENHIYGFYKDGDFDRSQNNACYGSFKSRFDTLFNK